jgi:hypothetical protein
MAEVSFSTATEDQIRLEFSFMRYDLLNAAEDGDGCL